MFTFRGLVRAVLSIAFVVLSTEDNFAQVVSFSIPQTLTAKSGDTLSIPLFINVNGNMVGSFDATLSFKNSLLIYSGNSVGPIIPSSGWHIDVNGNNSTGMITVGALDMSTQTVPLSGSGVAVTLRLVVSNSASAGDTCSLNLSGLAATDTSAKSLQVNGTSGIFRVLSNPAPTGPTPVQGFVSGTWTKAGSPYIVVSSITIPGGQSLTIQPGVVVKFGVGLGMTVNGKLIAVGSETDSILFTTTQSIAAPGQWGTITVTGSSDTSLMQYCIVEYGGSNSSWALNTTGLLKLMNSVLRYNVNGATMGKIGFVSQCIAYGNSGWGIGTNGGTIQKSISFNNGGGFLGGPIQNSVAKNNSGDGFGIGDGSTASLVGDSAIANGGNGISIGVHCDVSVLSSTMSGNKGDGLRLNYSSSVSVISCLVTGNSGSGLNTYSSTVSVVSCLVTGNKGSGLNTSNSSLTVRSSVISNNTGFGISEGAMLIDSSSISNNGSNAINGPSNAIIKHCVIYGNKGAALNNVPANSIIENNTVVGNYDGFVGINASGVIIRNNILVNNSGNALQTSANPLPRVNFNDIYGNGNNFSGF
ncbi:MAG: right-handed parallel beta-helix repeat-containing protein, partial [Candidatus Kryptoniota bacterium]